MVSCVHAPFYYSSIPLNHFLVEVKERVSPDRLASVGRLKGGTGTERSGTATATRTVRLMCPEVFGELKFSDLIHCIMPEFK